jgi:RNA polymerase sigma factor (sigma-70 family)
MLSADEEAEFWVFYRKTADVLFRKAYRMCRGQHADAEDAHQNTYLRALRHWSTVNNLTDKQRYAWLAKTLMREVLQLWRLQYRSWETRSYEDLEWQQIVAQAAPDTSVIDEKDLYHKTCLAIARLKGREQEVIALHCLAGYEVSEVAEMLEISPSTVRVHLHHGRMELRAMMAGEEGAADGDG